MSTQIGSFDIIGRPEASLNLGFEVEATGLTGSGTESDPYVVTGGQSIRCTAVSDEPIQALLWAVEGQTVASYTLSTGPSFPDPLTQFDLMQNPLEFFWIAGGTHSVSVQVITSSGQETLTRTFHITTPTIEFFNSDTGEVQIIDHNGNPALAFVDPFGDLSGISFNIRVQGTQVLRGSLAGVQLVNTGREVRLTTGGGQHLSTNGQWVLDNGGNPNEFIYQEPKFLEPNESQGLPLSDGPLMALDSAIITQAIANCQFRMHVMFCPVANSVVWIPLGVLEWFWQGTATFEGASWQLSNAANSQNPTGGPPGSPPQWMTNVASAIWINNP